jgi:hypothetical protein
VRSPTFVHVFPASADLNTPLPGVNDHPDRSPVPTYTVVGSDGATATAPTEATCTSSKTGFHVLPAFVVFHTPPSGIPA